MLPDGVIYGTVMFWLSISTIGEIVVKSEISFVMAEHFTKTWLSEELCG